MRAVRKRPFAGHDDAYYTNIHPVCEFVVLIYFSKLVCNVLEDRYWKEQMATYTDTTLPSDFWDFGRQ